MGEAHTIPKVLQRQSDAAKELRHGGQHRGMLDHGVPPPPLTSCVSLDKLRLPEPPFPSLENGVKRVLIVYRAIVRLIHTMTYTSPLAERVV